RGLSAEVFAILAGVPMQARTPSWRTALVSLAPMYEAMLDEPNPELLTYAHAVMGLWRAGQASVIAVDADGLRAAAVRLARMRQESHWEPSWFNAYGGTIEAAAAF